MKRIKIENVGPIKFAEFELNKVNVIMGPQSSGKSTIAKIISYCQWVEKRYVLDGAYKYKVSEELLDFHRLGKNYFSENSFIEYQSEFVHIKYTGANLEEVLTRKGDILDFEKSKNIYIPAERNFVSAIPDLGKYNETHDNIMSFVYDWYAAKRKFTRQIPLSILNLGVDFYNVEESDFDAIYLRKEKKEIRLRESSSGLQSISPLVVIIEYLTGKLFEEKKSMSVDEQDARYKMLLETKEKLWATIINLSNINDKDSNEKILERKLEELALLSRLVDPYRMTQFIIEEPEQNLFPETQRDLIYYLLGKLKSERNHTLTITTHSPYVLYALNNCMMGQLISNNLTEEEKTEFLSHSSWISPDLVSIFEIDKERGTLNSIKDADTGTVNKHYFNGIMNSIMNEYYEMLRHFEYEKK